MDKCKWKYRDYGYIDFYQTSCGERYFSIKGGPKENGHGYCAHCGKEVEEGKMDNIEKLKKDLVYWKTYARDICCSVPCVENIRRLEKEIKQAEKEADNG